MECNGIGGMEEVNKVKLGSGEKMEKLVHKSKMPWTEKRGNQINWKTTEVSLLNNNQ